MSALAAMAFTVPIANPISQLNIDPSGTKMNDQNYSNTTRNGKNKLERTSALIVITNDKTYTIIIH